MITFECFVCQDSMVFCDFWGIIKSEKHKEREIMDQRIIKLSDMLTSYSCDLQKMATGF